MTFTAEFVHKFYYYDYFQFFFPEKVHKQGFLDERGECLCIPADKIFTEREKNITLLDNQQQRHYYFVN
jgi:hypothetical protein